MKRCLFLLVLVIPLLAVSCVGEKAKAEYIRAKTEKIEAETALLELKLEQAQRSWEAAEARRANSEKIRVQTLRILAYIGAATIVAVSLIWATSGAYRVWAQNRVTLLEALEREAQARTRAMKEERLAHEAKVAAFKERRNLVEVEANRLEQQRLLLKGRGGNGRSLQSVTNLE